MHSSLSSELKVFVLYLLFHVPDQCSHNATVLEYDRTAREAGIVLKSSSPRKALSSLADDVIRKTSGWPDTVRSPREVTEHMKPALSPLKMAYWLYSSFIIIRRSIHDCYHAINYSL